MFFFLFSFDLFSFVGVTSRQFSGHAFPSLFPRTISVHTTPYPPLDLWPYAPLTNFQKYSQFPTAFTTRRFFFRGHSLASLISVLSLSRVFSWCCLQSSSCPAFTPPFGPPSHISCDQLFLPLFFLFELGEYPPSPQKTQVVRSLLYLMSGSTLFEHEPGALFPRVPAAPLRIPLSLFLPSFHPVLPFPPPCAQSRASNLHRFFHL